MSFTCDHIDDCEQCKELLKNSTNEIYTDFGLYEDERNLLGAKLWASQMLGGTIGFAIADHILYTAISNRTFSREEFLEKIRLMCDDEPFFHEYATGEPIENPDKEYRIPAGNQIRIIGYEEMHQVGEPSIFEWADKVADWK